MPIKTVDYDFNNRIFQMVFYDLNQIPPENAEKLIDFYKLWAGLRYDQKIPSRQNISFETLKGWHSNIRLVDLGQNIMAHKRNIIVGEIYKRHWGNETMYSQFVENNKNDIVHKNKYIECIECFMNYNYSISIGNTPNKESSYNQVAWIDLPLSNGENDEISYLITALIPYNI